MIKIFLVFLVSAGTMAVLYGCHAAEGQESNTTESFFDGYEKNFTVSNLTIGELPPP